MIEDKQKICNLLSETLRATTSHSDLMRIRYEKVNGTCERAVVEYENGCTRIINVSMDSGTAMIRDIVGHI